MSQGSRRRADALKILFGTGAGFVGAIAGMRVLTQFASEAAFGESKVALALVALVAAVSGRPFVQFAALEDRNAESQGLGHAFWKYAWRKVLFIGCGQTVAVVALLGVGSQFGYQLSLGCILAAGVSCIPDMLIGLGASLAISRNRQGLQSALEFLRALAVPVFIAGCLAAFGNTAVVLLAGQAIGIALISFAYWWNLRPLEPPPPSAPEHQTWEASMRAFALPLIFVAIFNWVISLADRTLLARFSSMQETGRYVAIYGLIGTPLVVAGGMVARFLQPLFYRADATAASKDRLFRFHLLTNIVAALGLALAVVLFRPLIVRIALAVPFRTGSERLVPWIAFGHAFLVISQAFELRSYSDRKVGRFFFTTGIAATVNTIANVVLIPTKGAEGAAMATFLSYLVYLGANILMHLRSSFGVRSS